MSLKQIIKRQKMLLAVVNEEFVLKGEPMIYSLKYPVGQRTRGLQFFRNKQFYSILKTHFRSFMRTNIPLVLVVRFFVSPPKGVSVAAKELRLESVPAVMCYELCDYTLSFLEMLHHVLFNSYRQVVKLDVIKVYSSNPRTTVKMMKWDEYVKLQGHDTIHPKAKSKHKDVARQGIQPKRARHEANSNARPQEAQGNAIAEGSSACDSALRASCPAQPHGKKTRAAKQKTTHKAP